MLYCSVKVPVNHVPCQLCTLTTLKDFCFILTISHLFILTDSQLINPICFGLEYFQLIGLTQFFLAPLVRLVHFLLGNISIQQLITFLYGRIIVLSSQLELSGFVLHVGDVIIADSRHIEVIIDVELTCASQVDHSNRILLLQEPIWAYSAILNQKFKDFIKCNDLWRSFFFVLEFAILAFLQNSLDFAHLCIQFAQGSDNDMRKFECKQLLQDKYHYDCYASHYKSVHLLLIQLYTLGLYRFQIYANWKRMSICILCCHNIDWNHEQNFAFIILSVLNGLSCLCCQFCWIECVVCIRAKKVLFHGLHTWRLIKLWGGRNDHIVGIRWKYECIYEWWIFLEFL